MPKISEGDKLAEIRNVTLILRLALNQRGEMTHGEMVDMEGESQGHFTNWNGLAHTLHAWLNSQKTDASGSDLLA